MDPRAAFRIVVVGNHHLIALINVPVNVTLVMIQDQHGPVFAAGLCLSADPFVPVLQPHDGLGAPIRVGSRVDRVLQHAEHCVISGGLPHDLARLVWSAQDRQLDLLLIQPEIGLPHAAQFRELPKDQIQGGSDPGVRIFLEAIVPSLDVPGRGPPNQGASLRLLPNRGLGALTKARYFHLADGTLHAQQ